MRYIDVDALIEKIQETVCTKCGDIYDGIKCKSCGIDDTLNFLEDAPTADVVPRDEVERYKGVCDDLQYEILELLNDLHNESEYVAKKIFEEIERNIFILETPYQPLHCIPSGFIEELKEKYTKGGEGE